MYYLIWRCRQMCQQWGIQPPSTNPYVGYNYHGVPRMSQAIPIIPRSVAGISQQGQTQGTFDMQPQSGQSYVDMLNK